MPGRPNVRQLRGMTNMEEARTYGDRWRVLRELGKGGQGIVYLVLDASGLPLKSDEARMFKAAFRPRTS
jgi:hypothetical protein